MTKDEAIKKLKEFGQEHILSYFDELNEKEKESLLAQIEDTDFSNLARYKEPPVEVADEKLLFRLIRASFNQRRKTLANGLNNSSEIQLPKEVIIETIEKLGKGAGVRGEALTLEEFAKLSNTISEML